MRDYNGQRNDDRVEVAWLVGASFGDAGAPAWNGADQWPVDRNSVGSSPDGGPSLEEPRFVDHSGYVADGVLVANLPNAELELQGDQSHLLVHLTAASVVGRLEQTTTGWAVRDGLLTGRVIMPDVFRAISSLRNELGDPMCIDHPAYGAGKDLVCAALDTLASAGPPSLDCDALSVGIAFEADPANLGAIEVLNPVLGGCLPARDPARDSCP